MSDSAREWDRQRAVERYLSGEGATAICDSMGYSRAWLYRWVGRYRCGESEWYVEASSRPHSHPKTISPEIEREILAVRRSLDREGLFCGAQALLWELEDLGIEPLPSMRTIARVVSRHGLVRRRRGRYVPKGKRYSPRIVATRPGDLHESDFVGPCYLHGGGSNRFYSLHSIDLATGRCGVEPMLHRSGQATIDGFWATWCRLGMPLNQQIDNEMVFYGSPRHPRGMGPLIRLCLHHGIEPWFIPLGEPWRNPFVEKFNDYWRKKFFGRTAIDSTDQLRSLSHRFEQHHNARWRYGKLSGKTPGAALRASGVPLRFPPSPEPPRHPLPKPTFGRYHLVRFVRSSQTLDIFGELFPMPPEATYEYVHATVDVASQRLAVSLDGRPLLELDYPLR